MKKGFLIWGLFLIVSLCTFPGLALASGDVGGMILPFLGLGGMIINRSNLATLETGFKATFNRGFAGVTPLWSKVATLVPSTTAKEDYGWLGSIPQMREWLGSRVINNLKLHDYSIRNKSFESTVGVPVTAIDDDSYGVYAPMMEMLGSTAAEHPDILIFIEALAGGFTTECYDGQFFFDTDHPVMDAAGVDQSVSNYQAGASDSPWYLLDTRRPIKPLILQMRKTPKFVAMNQPNDHGVFMEGEAIFGVDDRKNAGYGLWQMAHGSKATLTAANFELVYDAMTGLKGDHERPLGIKPNLLVVGSKNASNARKIITAQNINGGDSNTNFNRVELLECPWLP